MSFNSDYFERARIGIAELQRQATLYPAAFGHLMSKTSAATAASPRPAPSPQTPQRVVVTDPRAPGFNLTEATTAARNDPAVMDALRSGVAALRSSGVSERAK